MTYTYYMNRIALIIIAFITLLTASTARDPRNQDLVLDPAFTASEVQAIETAVATWVAEGFELRVVDYGHVNVKRMTGPGLPSAEGNGAVQLAAANTFGILVWVAAIKGAEQLEETMTHELTHYMGVDFHDEDGDCTNAFTIHCAGGPSKADIAHVHAAQHSH